MKTPTRRAGIPPGKARNAAKRTPRLPESSVERVYQRVRSMAMTYEIRPGDRVNEVELCRRLDVSRTPLREALNRLVNEGFLTVRPNHGFFSRSLDAKEVFDLYELRSAIEAFSVRLACERAQDADLIQLEKFVIESRDEPDDQRATRLLQLDQAFHEWIAELSGNLELRNSLRSINGKIYFVRWIDMQGRRSITQSEHLKIVKALRDRNDSLATDLMAMHITRRLDQIVDCIKIGFAEIYMPSGPSTKLTTRRIYNTDLHE